MYIFLDTKSVRESMGGRHAKTNIFGTKSICLWKSIKSHKTCLRSTDTNISGASLMFSNGSNEIAFYYTYRHTHIIVGFDADAGPINLYSLCDIGIDIWRCLTFGSSIKFRLQCIANSWVHIREKLMMTPTSVAVVSVSVATA